MPVAFFAGDRRSVDEMSTRRRTNDGREPSDNISCRPATLVFMKRFKKIDGQEKKKIGTQEQMSMIRKNVREGGRGEDIDTEKKKKKDKQLT